MSLPPRSEGRLLRVLGPFASMCLVVGSVIGTGIFLKSSTVLADVHGYVVLALAAWLVCGLLSLCGALSLSELATMLPHAGGSYVYLREAYGPLWAFLWGWAELLAIRTGATAALAAGFTITLNNVHPLEPGDAKLIAIGLILALAVANVLGTRRGAFVQNVTTIVKAGALVFLMLLPLAALVLPLGQPAAPASVAADGEAGRFARPVDAPDVPWTALVLGFGAAMSGVLWAYDGWGNLTTVAEEMRDPARHIPRAMIGGVGLLIVLYLGTNLAYHAALPAEQLQASEAVGIEAAETMWPRAGGAIITGVMLVSIFGALNANLLSGPRVLFAMSRDRLFVRWFSHVDPRFSTPALAIGAQALWAVALVLVADFGLAPGERIFDVLTDYSVFTASIFYTLMVVAVFVLRRRRPDAYRPYRTWGYPWVPAVFVTAYAAYLVAMCISQPRQSLAGLAIVSAGFAFYPLFARAQPFASMPSASPEEQSEEAADRAAH